MLRRRSRPTSTCSAALVRITNDLDVGQIAAAPASRRSAAPGSWKTKSSRGCGRSAATNSPRAPVREPAHAGAAYPGGDRRTARDHGASIWRAPRSLHATA